MSNSTPQNDPQIPSPQRTAEAKAAFEASLRSVGANYEADLRDRARNLHDNAAALDKQETDVRRATAGLARQNDQLAKVADAARDGLKEIGDVQNWAELIERDLLVIEETVRLAEEREDADENKRRQDADHDHVRVDARGDVLINGGVEGEDDQEHDRPASKSWFRWW
ncbi:hypothetical protein BDV59DRAFT_54183 [Aspergillus ambiguus]|uniref:uncharacterized protein n=1 Tax=Aspergillus ambiguus TaxID=176160 RepID=UPI003CCCA316